MNNTKKWVKEYTENVDLNKIEWIKLNAEDLKAFFDNNYLDKKTWEYVCDKDANTIYPTILGMNYLNFDNPINNKKYSYLLGIVSNSIGKKTVVAATIYIDKYFMFNDQENPITYISTMEVNSFFRNKGLFKQMCKKLLDFIDLEQHIVATKESVMGKKYNTFAILESILISKGFKKRIFVDNHGLINSELHDIVCTNKKRK